MTEYSFDASISVEAKTALEAGEKILDHLMDGDMPAYLLIGGSLNAHRINEELDAEVGRLEAENERLNNLIPEIDELITRLNSWCRAYPYDVFIEVTEPDWKRANEVLNAAGLSMTGMNGSNMRHVIAGVKEIADGLMEALEQAND